MASNKKFVYDTPHPYLIRLFKLDLNGPNGSLSGKLLSITNTTAAFVNFDFGEFMRALTRFDEKSVDTATEELGDGKGYDALSYCWGDFKESYPLELSIMNAQGSDAKVIVTEDASRASGTIQIQHNLHACLEELRRKQYNRFIWIDAICIDQSNTDDKDSQIPLMRNIYDMAGTVYIWLGEASADEASALRLMPELTEKLRSMPQEDTLYPEMPATFERAGLPPPTNDCWKALGTLMTRSWWSRLWTLQEVVVAQAAPSSKQGSGDDTDYTPPNAYVLCGDIATTWAAVEDFASAAARRDLDEWIVSGHWGLTIDDRHGFDSIKEVRTAREGNVAWSVSLSALLLATRRRKATVPADMVIGQSALLDTGMIRKLGLTSSQPVERVFIKFGKHYIRQEIKEVLLNHVCTRDRLVGLPSWCPNFASPAETVSLGSRWLGHDADKERPEHRSQMYHAGFTERGKWTLPYRKLYYAKLFTNVTFGRDINRNMYNTDNPRQIQLIKETDHIRLSGLDLDEVTEVIDCNPAAGNLKFLSFNSIQQTHVWDEVCFDLARQTLPEGSEGFDTYARTLTANRLVMFPTSDVDQVFDPDQRLDFVRPYLGFRRFIQATLNAGETIAEEGNLAPEVARFVRVMERVTKRRRFFATRSRRIGLGPSDTSVGDKLVVAFYCPTPYLLRVGERTSRVVGEAYVHGLMYGEALKMFDAGQAKETKWDVE